jgi:hypothetical protein
VVRPTDPAAVVGTATPVAGSEANTPPRPLRDTVSDEDAIDTDDPEALEARARRLKTRLRILRMRAESANFEDREAYRRAIGEKEAEIEELEERAELAAIDVDLADLDGDTEG